MNEIELRSKVESAAWDAALSLVNREGELTEEFDDAFKRFLKRKVCSKIQQEYCQDKLKAAINVVQYSVKFMRTLPGALPPKPVRRYELLLTLAQELEIKCPEASTSLQMAGCRYVELHWDR